MQSKGSWPTLMHTNIELVVKQWVYSAARLWWTVHCNAMQRYAMHPPTARATGRFPGMYWPIDSDLDALFPRILERLVLCFNSFQWCDAVSCAASRARRLTWHPTARRRWVHALLPENGRGPNHGPRLFPHHLELLFECAPVIATIIDGMYSYAHSSKLCHSLVPI